MKAMGGRLLAIAVLVLVPAVRANAQNIDISGFLVLEAEWVRHREGPSSVLWEINRLRLDFSSEVGDHFSVLAQFAPVPEEITHPIEKLHLSDGRDLPLPDTSEEIEEEEGTIPFERIELRWQNALNGKLNFSFGQLRNSFGHWEDFTAHRNTTLTKNNFLVLGIALRNLDLGMQADGELTDWLDYKVGIRKGNNVNTADLKREDNNQRYDIVGRIGLSHRGLGFGINAYSVDTRSDKFALGIDWQASISQLTLMGEGVLQKNTPEGLRSLAGYIQANYNLARLAGGLRWYLLCDYWRLEANSRLETEALGLYTGIKYKVLAEGMTVGLEWGRTYIGGVPDPWHVTGQMQVEF